MLNHINQDMLILALSQHARAVTFKEANGQMLSEDFPLCESVTFSCEINDINDLKVGTYFQVQRTGDTFILTLKEGERDGFEEVIERFYKDTFNIPVITMDDFCAITKEFSPYNNASDVYSLALRKEIHAFDADNSNNLSIRDRLALYHMIKFVMEKQPENQLVKNIIDKGLYQKLQVGVLGLADTYQANNAASIKEMQSNIVSNARSKNFKEEQYLSLTQKPTPNLRNG